MMTASKSQAQRLLERTRRVDERVERDRREARELHKRLGQLMRDARERSGISRVEVVARTGLTYSQVARIEYGYTLDLDQLEAYAEAIDLR